MEFTQPIDHGPKSVGFLLADEFDRYARLIVHIAICLVSYIYIYIHINIDCVFIYIYI